MIVRNDSPILCDSVLNPSLLTVIRIYQTVFLELFIGICQTFAGYHCPFKQDHATHSQQGIIPAKVSYPSKHRS